MERNGLLFTVRVGALAAYDIATLCQKIGLRLSVS